MGANGKRRALASVITQAAIAEELRRIQGFLRGCAHNSVPQTTDAAERERRLATLNEAATLLLVGALVALREYEPTQYRRLVTAVGRFATTALEKGWAGFEIRRSRRGRQFAEWLSGIPLLGLHNALKKRLQKAWRESPRRLESTGSGIRWPIVTVQ